MNSDKFRIVCFEHDPERVKELRRFGDVLAFLSEDELSISGQVAEEIRAFAPRLAIVDLVFGQNKVAGVRAVRNLGTLFPTLPVAVWTVSLIEDPKREVRSMIEDLGAYALSKNEDLQGFIDTI